MKLRTLLLVFVGLLAGFSSASFATTFEGCTGSYAAAEAACTSYSCGPGCCNEYNQGWGGPMNCGSGAAVGYRYTNWNGDVHIWGYPKTCPSPQTGTPPNCECPQGQEKDPSNPMACRPVATCPEGQLGTPPNCTCPADKIMQGTVCVVRCTDPQHTNVPATDAVCNHCAFNKDQVIGNRSDVMSEQSAGTCPQYINFLGCKYRTYETWGVGQLCMHYGPYTSMGEVSTDECRLEDPTLCVWTGEGSADHVPTSNDIAKIKDDVRAKSGACPSGFYSSGGLCYAVAVPKVGSSQGNECPGGFTLGGDRCRPFAVDIDDPVNIQLGTAPVLVPNGAKCPEGYSQNGNLCTRIDYKPPAAVACEAGYSKDVTGRCRLNVVSPDLVQKATDTPLTLDKPCPAGYSGSMMTGCKLVTSTGTDGNDGATQKLLEALNKLLGEANGNGTGMQGVIDAVKNQTANIRRIFGIDGEGPASGSVGVKVNEDGTPSVADGGYGVDSANSRAGNMSDTVGKQAWDGSVLNIPTHPRIGGSDACVNPAAFTGWKILGHSMNLDVCSVYAPFKAGLAFLLYALTFFACLSRVRTTLESV